MKTDVMKLTNYVMGLDMHVARRHFVANYKATPKKRRYAVQVTLGGKPLPSFDPARVTRIEEELMTWRKANHIHAWFVDNVQDGEDDCGTYVFFQGTLRELLDRCQRVIEASELVEGTVYNGTTYSREHPDGIAERIPGKVIKDPVVAKDLLPTRDGFFFGCTEYDEDYLDEVVRTRDWIVQALAELEDGALDEFIYWSSW